MAPKVGNHSGMGNITVLQSGELDEVNFFERSEDISPKVGEIGINDGRFKLALAPRSLNTIQIKIVADNDKTRIKNG